jgi:hypothetical protein
MLAILGLESRCLQLGNNAELLAVGANNGEVKVEGGTEAVEVVVEHDVEDVVTVDDVMERPSPILSADPKALAEPDTAFDVTDLRKSDLQRVAFTYPALRVPPEGFGVKLRPDAL